MRAQTKLVLALAPLSLLGGVGCAVDKGDDVTAVQSAIVGGTPVPPGKYPWMAFIRRLSSDGFYDPTCGGSLIAPDWVLTAQHCVRKPDNSLYAPGDFQITLGDNDISATEPADQVRGVAEVVPAPGFAAPSIEDLALLRLSTPATLNARVQLIRLAADGDGPGQNVVLAGWGSDVLGGNGLNFTPLLNEIATRLVGPDEQVLNPTNDPNGNTTTCRVIAENAIGTPQPSGRPLNDGDLCTAILPPDLSNKSACFGDSGSPLIIQRTPTCAEEVGLIVTGNPFCSDYNIHMRISTRLDWIRSRVPGVASRNVYEAETMNHPVGNSYPGGWNIFTNGYSSFTHTFAGGPTQMVVSAAGQSANNVAPIMQITVNGTTVFTTSVAATTFTDYPFTFNAPTGNAEVRVNFTNDLYQPPLDRNLFLDKVKIITNTCATATSSGPFSATINVYDDWGAGYCARVRMTNGAATATTGWTVVVNTGNSTVTGAWNSPSILGTGNHTITPIGWNAAIAANTTYDQTGFCATRAPGTTTVPNVVSATATY